MSDFLGSPPPRARPQPDQAATLEMLATLFLVAFVVVLLYVGREIFIPIAIAILVSFVLSPPSLSPSLAAIVEAPLSDLPRAGPTTNRDSEKPILCLAGRSFLDEAAAALFAQILEKHGMGAKVGPAGALDRRPDFKPFGRRCAARVPFVLRCRFEHGGRSLRGSAPSPASRRGREFLAGFWQSGPGQVSELCAATKAEFCATRFKEALAFCLHEAVEVEKGEPACI